MMSETTASPLKTLIGNGIGGILTVVGFILTWSPIPFGFVVLFSGIAILVGVNPWVRRLVEAGRTRSSKFNNAVGFVQTRAPSPIANALARTEPAPQSDASEHPIEDATDHVPRSKE